MKSEKAPVQLPRSFLSFSLPNICIFLIGRTRTEKIPRWALGGDGTVWLNLVPAWEQWVQKSYRKEMSLAFGANQGKISGRDNKSGATLSVVQDRVVLVGFIHAVVLGVWKRGTCKRRGFGLLFSWRLILIFCLFRNWNFLAPLPVLLHRHTGAKRFPRTCHLVSR